MTLQKTRIDRVKSQADTTDSSHRDLLIKPLYLTSKRYNKYNNYQRGKYSPPPVANHSLDTLNYNGEKWNYCAEEGEWVEFKNKKGDRIAKHKWKVNEPIKKFDATLKVAS
jgi:hypothetical protein